MKKMIIAIAAPLMMITLAGCDWCSCTSKKEKVVTKEAADTQNVKQVPETTSPAPKIMTEAPKMTVPVVAGPAIPKIPQAPDEI